VREDGDILEATPDFLLLDGLMQENNLVVGTVSEASQIQLWGCSEPANIS